jgi:hypothetical protein
VSSYRKEETCKALGVDENTMITTTLAQALTIQTNHYQDRCEIEAHKMLNKMSLIQDIDNQEKLVEFIEKKFILPTENYLLDSMNAKISTLLEQKKDITVETLLTHVDPHLSSKTDKIIESYHAFAAKKQDYSATRIDDSTVHRTLSKDSTVGKGA